MGLGRSLSVHWQFYSLLGVRAVLTPLLSFLGATNIASIEESTLTVGEVQH